MRMRAAVVTALLGVALLIPSTPATAAACPQGSGVSVLVDFASLGGGTQTNCAAGDPSTGLAAMRAAGFTPTRAAQQPSYFVCRINGKPANDPCQRTSPADAYWSYWHAKPGGAWTYSGLGPEDYDPKPGTVEGWAFGAGKPPSSLPPRSAPAQQSAPATVAASPTPPPSRAASPRPAALPASPAAPSTPSPAPSLSPSPRDAVTPQPVAAEPEPSLSEDTSTGSEIGIGLNDSGPGVGVVVGAVLLAALVAAGLLQARARRRREGD